LSYLPGVEVSGRVRGNDIQFGRAFNDNEALAEMGKSKLLGSSKNIGTIDFDCILRAQFNDIRREWCLAAGLFPRQGDGELLSDFDRLRQRSFWIVHVDRREVVSTSWRG